MGFPMRKNPVCGNSTTSSPLSSSTVRLKSSIVWQPVGWWGEDLSARTKRGGKFPNLPRNHRQVGKLAATFSALVLDPFETAHTAGDGHLGGQPFDARRPEEADHA